MIYRVTTSCRAEVYLGIESSDCGGTIVVVRRFRVVVAFGIEDVSDSCVSDTKSMGAFRWGNE